jgi:MSHA pilin protein MshA
MHKVYNNQGFTLIELIAVITILALLAAVAVPKFIDLGEEARIASINALESAAKSTSSMVLSRAQLGVGTQEVAGRDDLLDIDLDNNGSFETRLKWHFLDNTDLENWVSLSDQFVINYAGIDRTFIGYDFDNDGQSQDDNCYFLYRQANNEGDSPQFSSVTTGC